MNKLQEKHLLPQTDQRGSGYLDRSQVNQDLSFYRTSKPNVYGHRLVYQSVTMNDGTRYELLSNTGSTRGIIPNNINDNDRNLLQRDIKALAVDAINY